MLIHHLDVPDGLLIELDSELKNIEKDWYKYPGRSWFQNCLNQEFIGQNFKFEVPENGLQKSIIYVFVMKKMQKKNS